MNEKISCLFEQVARVTGFEISGDFIPSPTEPKPHLFINCICPNGYANIAPEQLLEKCRNDAHIALKAAIASIPSTEFLSICLSLYEIPKQGTNIRIYRTRINRDKLSSLTTGKLEACISGEESQIPSIRALLS